MARILLAWELGGGLGHLGRLLPLSRELHRRGHELVLACQDPSTVSSLLKREDIKIIQSPQIQLQRHIREPANYAEVLNQFGLDDPETVYSYSERWLDVYAAIQPEAILFDFSPVALLSAMSSTAKRILFGTGFGCPPDNPQLPSLRPWQDHYPERLRMSEEVLLESINQVLARREVQPLTYFAELFNRVDLNALATFPELDHCPGPRAARYWGSWSLPGGDVVSWPAAGDFKVFVYLKPFYGLKDLLKALQARKASIVMYAPGLPAELRSDHANAQLHIADRPLAIQQLAATADLAISHAGHGLSSEMLLAGVPLLGLPHYAEQKLLAHRIEHLGAGEVASLDDGEAVLVALDRMIENSSYRRAAQAFAQKYAGRDSTSALESLAQHIEQVMGADSKIAP